MSTQTADPSITTHTSPIEDVAIFPFEQNDDPNRKAHWVRPSDNGIDDPNDPTTSQDIVDLARMSGAEVVAACGHTFVPKHNPKGLGVCETCTDIAANAITGGGL